MNSGKVVLVTGCSSGFGRVISETLARKNYHVFATMRALEGRSANAACELQAAAAREALLLRVLELDVTDDASVERAIDAVIQEAGRIDVLINNAGCSLHGLLEASTFEQVQRIFDINFFGVVRMNRAVLPHMRRQGSGLLLHISSMAGRIVIPGLGIYSASKFALEALAEAYHHELASQGIDSVILEPGAYATAISQNVQAAADVGRAATYGPVSEISKRVFASLGPRRDPQEVADLVLHLIQTPAGSRPLRVAVGVRVDGLRNLNEVSEQIQKGFLDMTGLAPLTTFQASAASTD